jgi:hypothetical protein
MPRIWRPTSGAGFYLKLGFEAAAELRMTKGPNVWPTWRAPAIAR